MVTHTVIMATTATAVGNSLKIAPPQKGGAIFLRVYISSLEVADKTA
jgi:hypothetical protein